MKSKYEDLSNLDIVEAIYEKTIGKDEIHKEKKASSKIKELSNLDIIENLYDKKISK